MQKKNNLKERLKKKKELIGTWSVIPSSTIAEILGISGLDFVIIDQEHGPQSLETSQDSIRALENVNCTPLLRVSNNDPDKILRALEIGAHGIVVPNIKNYNDAKKAISSIYYKPKGNRGVSAYTRSSNYSPLFSKSRKFTNENILSVLLLESVESIEKIDDILEIKGIDVLYFGTYDLSQSLGILDDINNPKLLKEVSKIIKKILNKGISAGVLIENISDKKMWKKLGFNFFLYKVDCGIFLELLTNDIKKIKK